MTEETHSRTLAQGLPEEWMDAFYRLCEAEKVLMDAAAQALRSLRQ